MFNKLKKFFKSKRAVGSVAAAIKVGTACVLGAAVLVGGVALTNDVVLPNTSDKVNNVAEYEGGEINGGSTNPAQASEPETIPNMLRVAKNRGLSVSDGSIFKECSLCLTDCVGLNYLIDLSELTESEKTGSYVTFEITNNAFSSRTVTFSNAIPAENGCYIFTCKLKSISMAETVTPTLHYGSETVVGPNYSVKECIDYVNENSSNYDDKTITLVNSIGNYGYYAQQYLSTASFTSLSTSYKTVDSYSDKYETYKSAIADKEISATGITNGNNASTGQYKQNANFDSLISYVIPIYNQSLTVYSTYPGETVNARPTTFNQVTLKDIPITELGTTYRISGTINGRDYSIDASAFSYAYAVLGSTSTTSSILNLKNLCCALYEYHLAAVDYANSYGSGIGDYSPVSSHLITVYSPQAPEAP